MTHFQYSVENGDHPDVVPAERLGVITYELSRIADELEQRDEPAEMLREGSR